MSSINPASRYHFTRLPESSSSQFSFINKKKKGKRKEKEEVSSLITVEAKI